MKGANEMATKAALLKVMGRKLRRLKPHQRLYAVSSLKYNSKAELLHKARNMKVTVGRG